MGNVKILRSTDYGAPELFGAIGALLPVLDACLVDGYGLNNIVSLTHTGGVVTATTELAHNLLDFSRQTIAGANEAGYNGEFIIKSVDTFIFTYEAAGITDPVATGTITTKSAGAGWTKAFSDTNITAYRQGAGNMMYLKVIDTITITARAYGFEDMSSISVGTGQFPLEVQQATGMWIQKSSTADGTIPRPWIIIADDRQFFFHVNWNSGAVYTDSPMVHFGDFISYKSGDQYNTHFVGNVSGAVAGFRFGYIASAVTVVDTGHFIARSYTQTGSSVYANRVTDYSKSAQTGMGNLGLIYPHPVEGGMLLSPVWIGERAVVAANSVLRGHINGLWSPLHVRPLWQGDTFEGTGTLAGKQFIVLGINPSAECMIEIPLAWTW